MANNKRFVVKNGLTTQNIQLVDDISSSNNSMTVEMQPSNELVVASSDDQLLVISDDSNTVFTINDSTGIPAIQITSYGNVLIGDLVDNGVDKVQASGSLFSDTVKTSNLAFKTQQGSDVIASVLRSNTEVVFVSENSDVLSMGSDSSSTIFAVNDFSGTPNIEVDTNGSVRLAPSVGSVLIGTVSRGISKLRIVGLPTSSTGLLTGDVWNDNGTLKIVT